MIDVSTPALEKGMATIRGNFDRQIKKGTATEGERDAALGRIAINASLDAVADRDLVVEAATENEALKFAIFRDLDRLAPPAAILATNTSSISVTTIAARRSGRDGDRDALHEPGAGHAAGRGDPRPGDERCHRAHVMDTARKLGKTRSR